MARVTAISPNGELKLCRTMKFEKNRRWTEILGRIPPPVQGTEMKEGADPESEYIRRLVERLEKLYGELRELK